MAHLSLIDAFDDCMSRIASGQTLESCLRLYPSYALQLRPLLMICMAIRRIHIPEDELREDQALVWQQITRAIPLVPPQRRRTLRFDLLAAVLLLLFLTAAVWFVLSRPDLPPDDRNNLVPLTETLPSSPSATLLPTATASPTAAPTLTVTTSLTPTLTVSITLSPTLTASVTQSLTPTLSPTPTFAPGCGAPLTEQDAIDRVLAIYPNVAIQSISQQIKFGETLVWEVRTTHGVEVNIDVACDIILTIERSEENGETANANDNVGSPQNTNTNTNSNADDNTNDNGGGNDNANDNDNDNESSGMGSD